MIEWFDLAIVIISWEIGKAIYQKLFHKPLYQKRSTGVTLWMRGTTQSKQETYKKFLDVYGPED